MRHAEYPIGFGQSLVERFLFDPLYGELSEVTLVLQVCNVTGVLALQCFSSLIDWETNTGADGCRALQKN